VGNIKCIKNILVFREYFLNQVTGILGRITSSMGNAQAGSAVVSNDMMTIITNWEEFGRKQFCPMLQYFPRMCLR
jgi:hypothetical protein